MAERIGASTVDFGTVPATKSARQQREELVRELAARRNFEQNVAEVPDRVNPEPEPVGSRLVKIDRNAQGQLGPLSPVEHKMSQQIAEALGLSELRPQLAPIEVREGPVSSHRMRTGPPSVPVERGGNVDVEV